jgi:AraC-like DNA-binding protein
VLITHRAWLDSTTPTECPRPGCPACGSVIAAAPPPYTPTRLGLTLNDLARHTATSRATLARRFPALVGETPGGYLTRWRMDRAAWLLCTTGDPIGPIARSVGYTSEYAFNRAFARAHGVTPGRYRAQHRE